MGAGVPQATINRRVRTLVRKAFDKYNGIRIEGRGANTMASGVYDGKAWTFGYNVLRASNGEVALTAQITIDGVPVDNLDKALAPPLPTPALDDRRASARLYVEWGYKAAERGWNIQRTIAEFEKVYTGN